MEKLLELPPLAIITFGAVLALIFGVRYLGLWQGQNASPAVSSGAAQVAAVIVDPSALNAAAAELARLSIAVHALVGAMREAGTHSKHIAEEINAIREEMRIHREVSRR